jgi:AraC-like DNA-binding protein
MNTEYQPKFHYVFQLFEQNAPISIYEIGTHKTPPNHSFGPAVRPFYLLHLIEKGKGFIERNGVKQFLSEGEAFLITPDEITTYCADSETPWEYSWIAFQGSFAKQLLEHTTQQLCPTYQKSGLLALKNAVYNQNLDYLDCLNVLFEVLNSIKDTPKAQDCDNISTALHYLENNYFHQIDIASLAEKFGFSRAYFSSLFAQKTGETPYDYLTKIRIEKAKNYLIHSNYSIEEIAFSVGFNSLQRFSELFKKRLGVSPLSYRKQFTMKV